MFSPAAVQQSTEILWDTYGVPHIFGKDTSSLSHAFGWAQMQSHGNLLLRLYGQARGRSWAEIPESDQWVQTMGMSALRRSGFSQLSRCLRCCQCLCSKHAEQIDDEVKAVLPVDAVDVLAHNQRVLNFTFVVDPESVANIKDNRKSALTRAIAPAHSATGRQ